MNLNFYEVYVNPSDAAESRFESLWKNEAIEKADQLKTQHPNQTVIVTLWNSATNREEVVYEAAQPATMTTPTYSEIFCCGNCHDAVTIEKTQGGDLVYQCSNSACQKAVSVDCPEALALIADVTLKLPVKRPAAPTRIRIPRGCEIVRQRDGFVMTAAHAMTVLATRDQDSGCMVFAHPARGLCYVMESWVTA